MDPYRDIVTDEDGEIVRKLVRKRDEIDNELQIAKRPRTNTDDLLRPEKPGEPPAEPLKREDSLQDYTRERLQRGLQYICQTPKKYLTPRTISFLSLCKEHYKVALEEQAPSEASCAVVQAMDQAYESTAFFHQVRGPSEAAFLDNFVKLRKLENLGNYGDYLGQDVQEMRATLRTEAGERGHQQAQAVSGRLRELPAWSEIAKGLEGADTKDLQKEVYTACGILNLDPEHMRNLIQQWADQNVVAYNHSREHIQECHWPRLAEQLCRDIKELPNIYTDSITRATFEMVMVCIREEYFDVYDPDDADRWMPNANGIALIQEWKERRERIGK
ncbi:MAG: hypothetical protein OHK93_004923 [Ramalina farinacea]|uniref:Uncharacterized protein n=1 Tax=Ramalina farinacea TaxID=258253 RepID=A0AA43QXE6_9LECA|nr:hypothetical protein [Ramalina farinacea]